jgi:hypothetical protein
MRNLLVLLQREPAAAGTLVASIIPVLILLGAMPGIDQDGIAAIVVAVNTVVGFAVRVLVSPAGAATAAVAAAERSGTVTV